MDDLLASWLMFVGAGMTLLFVIEAAVMAVRGHDG